MPKRLLIPVKWIMRHVHEHPLRLATTSLAVLLLSVALLGMALYSNLSSNRAAIEQNARTARALCDASAGARDFWIKVRHSTRLGLTDPTLSPLERRSNEQFVEALTDVIEAADGVAHFCDP